MEKKAIWYCTGCEEKCAVKIMDLYTPFGNSFMHPCLLFTQDYCAKQGYKPDWRRHEKHEPEVKPPF